MIATMKDKSPEHKPCRNLTETFEALCVVSPDETTKEEKTDGISNVVSPTSVHELDEEQRTTPEFPKVHLHKNLQRDLSDACVNRVSCYSIIHDINKEATSLLQHDPMVQLEQEAHSPLVCAAGNTVPSVTAVDAQNAVIDEEKWLLDAIDHRTSTSSCPATFLMAMGEKEYDSPGVLGTSRTQLWKPSRSWWEAKSGKNPWIEPNSHNKRWRYLWPLIHYHKFLAKCIKKLKRNGVDVKSSLSPVSIFLREEVCEVSDHLADVSLFGSEKWMECLSHFTGWTSLTATAERGYQAFIQSLPLRGFQEPGDVDSPVLRNQIDEAFLRTMAAQREQIRLNAAVALAPSVASSKTVPKISSGPPPTYPRTSPQVPRQIHSVRRPRYYPNGWYGWENYPDGSSVHSELSTNSYSQPHNGHYEMPHHGPHPMFHPAYYSDHSASTGGGYAMPAHYAGWVDPTTMYMMQQQYLAQQQHHSSPESPQEEGHQTATPFKYDPESSMSMSPYWSHLDQATLAMGLATPAKVSPSTPRRPKDANAEFANNAQAPLIRQTYYGDHMPSPATQFMMSPQASFAYNYGYGFSPRRLQKTTERVQSPNTVETTPESESTQTTA